MKPFLLLFFAVLLVGNVAPVQARQPCDRGAGGISHCEGKKFRCNDGRVSGSKQTCDPEIYGTGKKSGASKPASRRTQQNSRKEN